MARTVDLTGFVFGKLKVLEKAGIVSHHMMYRCLCTCGKEVVVRGSDMRYGRTRSCGGVDCKKMGAKMEAKKDCFAYVKRQGSSTCTALTELVCRRQECKFYAPLNEVCGNCEGKRCEKCLTVCYQNQMVK